VPHCYAELKRRRGIPAKIYGNREPQQKRTFATIENLLVRKGIGVMIVSVISGAIHPHPG
jgi:hypothetical protein